MDGHREGIVLSDTKVRNAKPSEKGRRLSDRDGLFLFVTTKGAKVWRLRFITNGREQTLSLGSYPEIGLADARSLRDDARKRLAGGEDPRTEPPPPDTPDPTQTLQAVTKRWHETNKARWKPHHADDVMGSLTRDILPTLGAKQINDVTAQMLLVELRKVEARGAIETAHAIRGRLSKVFAFAIGEGVAELNPAEMIKAAMKPIPKGGHRPAADTLDGARKVMTATEGIPAYPLTRLALRFLALTAVRPVEVSSAEWTEIDDNLWRIPGWRMKMNREHLVPLSQQAMDVLEAARPFSHRTPFIFVSATSIRKPMSENALNVMLRRAGMQGVHVPHGWRASFSTLMNERFPADRLVIDLMLAHAAKGEVEAAYNRAEHLDRRRELIQIWADLLMDGMPSARSIVELPRKSSKTLFF